MELAICKDQTFSLEPCHSSRPVHGVRFSQSLLASVGFDGSVKLWKLGQDDFQCHSTVRCSRRPLLQVDFLDKGKACGAASSDGSIYLIDCQESFGLLGKLDGHDSYVNGVCAMGEHSLASSSDDFTVKLWDTREQVATTTFELGREATSVVWSEAIPQQVLCGCLDNHIRCYDPRHASQPVYVMKGHSDMVTGLALSSDGKELISSALDGSLMIWNSAPFSPTEDRQSLRIPHGLAAGDSISDRSLLRCTFTPDNRYIAAGSGSGSEFVVCMWTRKGLPFKAFQGHSGFVNEVAFHPTENWMASCGMDTKLLVGTYL